MPEILGTLKPPRLASAPGAPTLGQIYLDTSDNRLKYWNGTVWVNSDGLPGDVVVPAGTRILSSELLAADTQPAFRIMGDGDHDWGPGGSTAPDVNLYRSVADVLKTDDQFHAAGGLTTKTKAGVPTDADTVLDADGTLIADTTNERLYARVAGAWKYAKLGTADPATGGVDYKGDWNSGTAYVSGDVVSYGGLEWLAVNPGTNQVPGAAADAGFGTALPGSPVDGMEFTLVDSLTAPTYAWRFRYVSGISDAYKWVYVGGSPSVAEVATADSGSVNANYVDTATVGPQITVARAGIYQISFGAGIKNNTAGETWRFAPKLGSAAGSDTDSVIIVNSSTNTPGMYGSRKITRTLAASDVVKLQVKPGGSGQWSLRWLNIVPVRVS